MRDQFTDRRIKRLSRSQPLTAKQWAIVSAYMLTVCLIAYFVIGKGWL
jgi:hypothetical protein